MPIEAFEKLKEDKRNNIYINAIKEFTVYGYNDANTIRIAAASGIAKGSIFNYFGSKKGCFLYLLNMAVDKIISEIKNKTEHVDADDLYECIALLFKAKVSLYNELALEMNFVISAFTEKSEEIRTELNQVALRYAKENEGLRHKMLIKALHGLELRDGVSADKVYPIMVGMLDTYTMKILKQYKNDIPAFFNNPEPVLDELKDYIDIIKYGILKA